MILNEKNKGKCLQCKTKSNRTDINKPSYCCGGQDCCCMGLPLEFAFCSIECENEFYRIYNEEKNEIANQLNDDEIPF